MEARGLWSPAPRTANPDPWPAGSPGGLVQHWVGGDALHLENRPHSECLAAVRAVQSYELAHGYIDIAYNVLACPHGSLIEGRGVRVRGAANGPATNSTDASCCALAGQGDRIMPGHLAAIEEARSLFPGRYRGHQEVNATSCPGPDLEAYVEAHRTAPAGPIPPAPTTGPGNQEPVTPPSPGGLVGLYLALHRMAATIRTGRQIRQGAVGPDVADVQLALVAIAGQKITVDGKFGPATDGAVRAFQRWVHLTPDGVVGPRTRRAFAEALAKAFP